MTEPPPKTGGFFYSSQTHDDEEALAVLRRVATARLGATAGEVVTDPDGSRHTSPLTAEQAAELLERIDSGAPVPEILAWFRDALRHGQGER